MKIFKNKQDDSTNGLKVSLKQMNFHEHFDQNIALILKNQTAIIKNSVVICLTNEALSQAIDDMKKEYPKDTFSYSQSVMGLSIDCALQQQLTLKMYGFQPKPLVISSEDLEPIRDIVDSFCIMYACARNQMSLNQAFALLEKKEVYYLGEPFTLDCKSFGVEVIARQQDDREYQSMKLFLTQESANQYNKDDRTISKDTLGNLYAMWKGTYGLIIEPHKNYWVEFGVQDIRG